MKELILTERIESRISQIRGKKIMLDTDLAKLYGVKTKRLIDQKSHPLNYPTFPIRSERVSYLMISRGGKKLYKELAMVS